VFGACDCACCVGVGAGCLFLFCKLWKFWPILIQTIGFISALIMLATFFAKSR
jgi:hypothetical protein